MDTHDRFVPRDDDADADLIDGAPANRDAEVDPDAVVDDETSVQRADAYDDAGASTSWLKRWQIVGLVAGGVAVAAGVAGAVYLRSRQTVKPKTLLEKLGAPKLDLSKAHPRRLSQMAGRRIEQLPVRQVQKRLADRVAHLFG